jgi:hypothetical protein
MEHRLTLACNRNTATRPFGRLFFACPANPYDRSCIPASPEW